MNTASIHNISGRFDISGDEAERIAATVETEDDFINVWENTDWWTDEVAERYTASEKMPCFCA